MTEYFIAIKGFRKPVKDPIKPFEQNFEWGQGGWAGVKPVQACKPWLGDLSKPATLTSYKEGKIK